MDKIAESLTDLIGNTPLLYPRNYLLKEEVHARLLLKLEYFNPGGSVKDRAAYSMIRDAEESGVLRAGATIIEPTG